MNRNIEAIQECRRLRARGLSLHQIALKVGRPKGTVWYWIKKIDLSPEHQKILRQNSEKARELGYKTIRANRVRRWKEFKKRAQAESKKLFLDPVFLIGMGIYMGEGDKSGDNAAGLTNCDPRIIAYTIKFFDKIGVRSDQMHAGIHIHDNTPEEEIKEYWSGITGIPTENFYKTQRIVGGSRINNRWPHGICQLDICNTEIMQKLKCWRNMILGSG